MPADGTSPASIIADRLPPVANLYGRPLVVHKCALHKKTMKGMENPLPPALHFLRICNWLFLHCLEKAKQYAAQKRELKKRQKDVETKRRTHKLCQIGGAVESVLGSTIEEEDIPKLIGFLKRQEANGKFFSKAMQKEPVANTEEV